MQNEIIKAVEREKIVVIVRGVPSEKLIPLAEAMYDGGIRLLEITYSASGIPSDEVTAENIKALCSHFKEVGKTDMHIGAGTVLTVEQVALTKAVGGEFIISPDTCPDVIKKTKELGLVSMPGSYTPSEIRIAHLAGADFVKVFPAVSLGASYIKAVKAPLSNIKLLAVGGINENNMSEYLAAGASGFGIGGKKQIKDAMCTLLKHVCDGKKEVIAASAEAVERSTSLGMIKIYEQAFRLTNPEHD